MRNICTIDLENKINNGFLNSDTGENELIVFFANFDEYKSNIEIEITDISNEIHMIDFKEQYTIPSSYYQGNGILKIRIISDEKTSDYIQFSCVNFNNEDNIYCKTLASNDFKFNIASIKKGFDIDMVYPIGSIYISVSSINPETVLGGKWERFANGKTLIGVSENDNDFNTVKKTGGEKTHVLTVAEIPSHTHTGSAGSAGAHTHSLSGNAGSAGAHGHSASSNSTGAHTHKVGSDKDGGSGTSRYTVHRQSGSNVTGAQYQDNGGSAGAHSHSITVNSGGAHTHTISGTAGSAGAHTHSVSIGATGSGGAHNNLQPFITVYMWLRVG